MARHRPSHPRIHHLHDQETLDQVSEAWSSSTCPVLGEYSGVDSLVNKKTLIINQECESVGITGTDCYRTSSLHENFRTKKIRTGIHGSRHVKMIPCDRCLWTRSPVSQTLSRVTEITGIEIRRCNANFSSFKFDFQIVCNIAIKYIKKLRETLEMKNYLVNL